MRHTLLIAFALAGCVPPQQPGYYPQPNQSQPGQPQPGYGQPQPGYAAAQPVAAMASCHDTMNCYGQCNPLTEACMGACNQRTTPESAQNAYAVLQCMAQSGCQDQNCVVQRCGTQITTCTNMTLAVAPTAPPPSSAPPASAGPDPVMQPEYSSVGTLWIPPPRRMLQQSDLAGEWGRNNGAVASYASANGNYAGFGAVSIGSKWIVDGQGGLAEDFTAARSGGYGAGQGAVKEHNTGTFTIDNRNVIALYRPAQNGNKEGVEYYVVVGWFVGPDAILMKLSGPYYKSISEKDIADAHGNGYMHNTYVKKR